MLSDDKERKEEAKLEQLRKLNATFHENYNVDLKSISNINNYMLDIEKSMDSVTQKLDANLMDREIKRFFTDQYKNIIRKKEEGEKERERLYHEVKKLKATCDAYEEKKNQIIIVLQQISENFENSLVGYLGSIIQEVFCGRPEAQTPIHTM